MTRNTTGSGWIITASADVCTITWSVDTNATSLFGISVLLSFLQVSDANNSQARAYQTVGAAMLIRPFNSVQ